MAFHQLRARLAEEMLGDSFVEPVLLPDQVVFVVQMPEVGPGRPKPDRIDFDVVRQYPGVALYYLWRLGGRIEKLVRLPERVAVVFPGEPQVAAYAPAGQAMWSGSFRPDAALAAGRVLVNGTPWEADPAIWARAADTLSVDADRWHGDYRPRGSLGPPADISPLTRARRLYEAALDLYPAHQRAQAQLARVEARLEAASLFGRAEALLQEHEGPYRTADRRHDDLGVRRHSFYLWRAADLLTQSLELDRDLLGAAASLDRVRRLLGARPRPPFDSVADLEAELRRTYEAGAVPLDYVAARSAGDTMRGVRVRLDGEVRRLIERNGKVVAAVVALAGGGGEAAGGQGSAQVVPGGTESTYLVYVQLPGPVPGQPDVEVAVGQRVTVWGELAGNYPFRDDAGRPIIVVRVAAAYVERSLDGTAGRSL